MTFKFKTISAAWRPQATAHTAKSLSSLAQHNLAQHEEALLQLNLFNAQQMEQHGRILAQTHKLSLTYGSNRLLGRLAENEAIISSTCNLLIKAVHDSVQITPAGEWLLDNFYLIEEQIRTAKRHFPKNYSAGLPRLDAGPSSGLPRVYDIALNLIAHGDARVDPHILTLFITAYQQIKPLNLGELWAIPIMLRLALIENLRRVAARTATSHTNRTLANHWADQMTKAAEKDPASLILVIADMARSHPPLESSFIAELVRRLQGQGPALALPLNWIEQRLAQSGLTVDQMIQAEIQQQAANQVSVSNSIGSLRFLGTMNWRRFVESVSLVDQVLLQDPTGTYAQMDFTTRDSYRHAIEIIAKRSELSETRVAHAALQLAQAEDTLLDKNIRHTHIGYYLIDKGLPQLEAATKADIPFLERLHRTLSHSLTAYLCSTVAILGGISATLIQHARQDHVPAISLVLLGLISVIASSHMAVAFTNWLATLLSRPHPLPRMDFSSAIPDDARTLVAVPAMLNNIASIDTLVQNLEIRFLANRNANLHFCLLTDFRDASSETLPQDDALIAHATASIEALNTRYSPEHGNKFFLMHRPRHWNAQEKIWMGYERKRGKLGALNAFLQHGTTEAFIAIVGNTDILSNVRYVITVDEDTQLPPEAAWKCIGTIAHPLNRPVYDPTLRRVVEGYGILQPRVAIGLSTEDNSLFAQFAGGEAGIDPYTRAVSDVYQDAFAEGSFIGKGIYDVAAFEESLKDCFPDNTVLSHDLIESAYARSGLLSDVLLYEDYPTRYMADVSRRHRWIRGDWQIAGWLLPTVPGPGGKRLDNTLSILSRWKIFDNLRRSVVPTAMLLLLLFGWFRSTMPLFWTLAVIALVMVSPIVESVYSLVRKPTDIPLRRHLAGVVWSAGRTIANAAFNLTTLPYDTWYTMDASLRAIWRMTVSHRLLLEWNPSAQTNHRGATDLKNAYREMWIAPALSIVLLFSLQILYPPALHVALLFVVAWLASPALVWWLSRPLQHAQAHLSTEQLAYLGKMTRKIWAFFDCYVSADDNYLPPDNVQEYPVHAVAHRTSPTNIGMALLANITALDFGYIGLDTTLDRITKTLLTMDKLERYKGHFYNWYNTQTLEPLYPVYISTVDSGNLAGHLLVLKNALLEFGEHLVISPRLFAGLRDTFYCLKDHAGETLSAPYTAAERILDQACTIPPVGLYALYEQLKAVQETVFSIVRQTGDSIDSDAGWWAQTLLRQCDYFLGVFANLTPWVLQLMPADPQRAALLDKVPSLKDLAEYDTRFDTETIQGLSTASARAVMMLSQAISLMGRVNDFAWMDYEFLYDREKHLLTIGYNLTDRRRDDSFYDLLASEARLTSFVGIAQGQLPQEHWFSLGRQLTSMNGRSTLLSWSGSMFEYLMPLLVMPTFDKTLLDQTYKASVKQQIDYGAQRNIPWGISESGYYRFDAHLNYQYRAFGVPGLGLKRGLANDLVVAPYASIMSLMVLPEEACANMQRLSRDGFEGRYGLYEAIDYTAGRMPRGKTHALIQSFMAHHQGMSFLSLSYLLLNRPMQKRFEAEPLFQATMLLLHEKIPKATAFYSNNTELAVIRTAVSNPIETPIRVLDDPNTPIPEVQLLSNGRYHVMVTNAGASSSRWKDLDVTRWREDATCDNYGTFCYIRDLDSGSYWSTGYQPTLKAAKHYEAIFSEGRAEFRRRDLNFEQHTEIVVSPEDDVEVRRTKITNRSRKTRTIEVTSYAEVVLAPHAADAAHPAFSNLFVQTEILDAQRAILCTRRARSANEQPPFMFHQVAVHGATVERTSYETDRMKFIGRGNTIATPQALVNATHLSNSAGSVLDPIVAIRHIITLEPEQTVTIDLITGAAEQRDHCLTLINKYQDSHIADRVFELAWTHSHVILRQLNASEADAQLYSRIANSILYANPLLRADPATLIKNKRGQSGLWSYAISGDLPIVLVQIRDTSAIDLVRQMLLAHAYWRQKGLSVDLVIWNEDLAVYRQALQDQILGLIAAGTEAHALDRPGGIFVRSADHISQEDRILFEAVARVIISDTKGTVSDQINRTELNVIRVPRLAPTQTLSSSMLVFADAPDETERSLFNGLGGFSPNGREYIITTKPGQRTPAPWSNVLANPYFGTVISESGQAYTWSDNAHAFRLTPWHNDPVTDHSGEAFYVRDEDSGEFWSPTPRPTRSHSPYTTRHGFGYSIFEHRENGIHTELCIYVAIDAPIKFYSLKVRNESGRTRKLSATGYVEWVLGDQREKSAPYVISEIDSNTGALLARNDYNTQFPDRTAFFDVDDPNRTITCDRRDFIGRNKNLSNPAAMKRVHLSGKVGAGLDPCAAIQVPFTLSDGEEHEIVFKMGIAGRPGADAYRFIQRYRGAFAARNALQAVHRYWDDALGAIQIETPDPALNMLTNGWLMYQTLACRMWARSGYYQSGGAFGFRDQLQDSMALVHTKPQLMRDHLLLAASHQFVEGDAQHWWHPPSDRGVRTRCSDDYLWLPLAVHHYVTTTGDSGVLDESAPFIEGRLLNPGEESYYDMPQRSGESASLYEHCVRAIKNGLKFGSHGLPLIGSCDWNDGMDRVGLHGQGESVWLGFFLYDILLRFAHIARMRNDQNFALLCETQATQIQANIEANGWDGNWYRRAYFDDGTPLGSAGNDECQIDGLSQSWSVLSGAGNPERSKQAMEAVNNRLIRRDHGLIQLLDPPFDKGVLNPGYIRGYVPGVRENGGQYTHAAVWTVMAFAKLKDRARTWELLQMINPLNHARTAKDVAIYKVEPYVVAADVYAVAPHSGRGGWTWYTGSSGWMYRLITESFLGIKLAVDHLTFDPCLPADWSGFTMRYKFYDTVYVIKVVQDKAATETVIDLDGVSQTATSVRLINDEQEHHVTVTVPC